MKSWKRTLAAALSAVMMVTMLASCGGGSKPAASTPAPAPAAPDMGGMY